MIESLKNQFKKGFDLHQQGQFIQAYEIYLQILKKNPKHFDTLHLIGMVENQRGNYQAAINYIEKALSINSNFDFVYNNLGNIFFRINNFEKALINFEKAISINQNFEKACFNKAEVLRKLNLEKEALEAYNNCLKINANNVDAHINKGVILFNLKSFKEAIDSFDKAILLNSSSFLAINNKGQALVELKDFEKALKVFNQLISLNLDDYRGYFQKANILYYLGKYEEALTNIDKAIDINSELYELLFIKGNVLVKMSLREEAMQAYNKTLFIKEDHHEAWNNKGSIFFLNNDFDSAIDSYNQSIKFKKNYAEAYYNLGKSYFAKNSIKYSLDSFTTAIKYKPDYVDAYNYIGIISVELKDFDKACASYEKALSLMPENNTILSNLIFLHMKMNNWRVLDIEKKLSIFSNQILKRVNVPFVSITSIDDPQLHQIVAKNYIDVNYNQPKIFNVRKINQEKKKIKIGYFSSDFEVHPVAQLTLELFQNHDRNKFDIIGFSLKSAKSEDIMRKRLILAFDKFFEVENIASEEIAKLSIDNEIDIAIDLNGHTRNARTDIFSYRAAPIQVNFLGYPGTMGASYYDYIIADEMIIPNECKCYYTEKIVYLPNSYQPNPSKRQVSKKIFSKSDLGLPENGIIFCCFNNNYKILPNNFSPWMEILTAVEGSVLWLKDTSAISKKNLIKEANNSGIESHRIIFANYCENLDEHLARLKVADLFLDTLPYNAQTTASDALWVGLPVLTCAGKSFSSRVASSILKVLDLSELITFNQVDYIETAKKLGKNPKLLEDLKNKLKINKYNNPLFNSKIYTKNLEQSYEKMLSFYNNDISTKDIFIK